MEVSRVDKNDYRIHADVIDSDVYYSIVAKEYREWYNCVYGENSACKDHNDKSLVIGIFLQWDGMLYDGKIEIEKVGEVGIVKGFKSPYYFIKICFGLDGIRYEQKFEFRNLVHRDYVFDGLATKK
ncbi:MAG: hypothetical protein ACRC0A_07040 [Chitinophagaceae bacterium]